MQCDSERFRSVSIARDIRSRVTEVSQGRPRLSVERSGNESSGVVVGRRRTTGRSYDWSSIMKVNGLGL